MKYRVEIVLERGSRHAPYDTRERIEQLLMPERHPATIKEFREIVKIFKVVSIDCYSEPTNGQCEEAEPELFAENDNRYKWPEDRR